jgi:Fe-S cluster assembly ATP-binding protein
MKEKSCIKEETLFEMSIEDRAREGLFFGFQYPVEIPGVFNGATL